MGQFVSALIVGGFVLVIVLVVGTEMFSTIERSYRDALSKRLGIPTDFENDRMILDQQEAAFMELQRSELETETNPLQRHYIAENLAYYDARKAKASANVSQAS